MRALQIGFEFEEVRKHRLWFRSFGILMIVIGLATAGSSIMTNAIFLGSLLVLAGLCQLVHSRACIRWSGLFLNLPSGILFFTAGLLIICDPAIDTLIRARLLAVLLIVIGCFRLFVALSIPLGHHGWMMLDGLTAIISGFLIWNSWPTPAQTVAPKLASEILPANCASITRKWLSPRPLYLQMRPLGRAIR
jgi:uncharacterized membrane protein HdeD (DUF308 family)